MIELNKIYCENCLDTMARMDDNCIDAIVTDPPYGISFMNKHWDYDVPSVEIWKEALRVLKPGGHLLSFGGTRTYHRMACAIEDAGFEIRDMVQWIYGSGFPKSLDISKAIDKKEGKERETIKTTTSGGYKRLMVNNAEHGFRPMDYYPDGNKFTSSNPITPEAQQWEGWGTALKPANEPICLARKPLSEKTVASNVLKWGTGGINIDGCRIGETGACNHGSNPDKDGYSKNEIFGKYKATEKVDYNKGRFPSNIILDGSDEVVSEFPNTKSARGKCKYIGTKDNNWIERGGIAKERHEVTWEGKGDSGSAARFFYVAKTSKAERGEGNNHCTVKPVKLMQYLCCLITPPRGIILDPFMGSGSTGIGAKLEGFSFIGIENVKEYFDIAEARIESWEVI